MKRSNGWLRKTFALEKRYKWYEEKRLEKVHVIRYTSFGFNLSRKTKYNYNFMLCSQRDKINQDC